MLRRFLTCGLLVSVLLLVGCTNKNVKNPIADVNSKQPDKVLYDRAMEAMKHQKYDVARLSLQTLINTYPESEYIARAKLAVGDSWYLEGGSAAMAQAESEYKDFETFFPNMPEAAEAQLKIANIHYREMEKADRDYTHAKRAEEEYRQLILQYPDSKLVPEAKQRLLAVQEVLAEREYMIGHFYYIRENWPAAIARLKSVADTYPLYSGADQALFELGGAYEREIELLRKSRLPESAKGAMIKKYSDDAAAAYDRIVTQYPLEDRAVDAKARLKALNRPVPVPTPEQVANDKAVIASRGSTGTVGKLMLNFKKGPDVSEASKVGDPTIVDPKQTSAPDMVRSFSTDVMSSLTAGATKSATVEQVKPGAVPPPENAPVPRSDSAAAPPDNSAASPMVDDSAKGSGSNAAAVAPVPSIDESGMKGINQNAAPAPSIDESGMQGVKTTPAAGGPLNGAPASDPSAVPEMRNDLPTSGGTAESPAKAPAQVNDAPAAGDTAASTASSTAGTQPASAADPNAESTSKKKKKHHFPF